MGEWKDEIMAIPYSLVLRSAIPHKPEMGNKTYVMAQYAQVMDLSALAEHMSSHDSKYNKGDVLAVLTQMTDCVREQLLLGNKVVLGDLGALSVRLKSTGVDNAESFGTEKIKTVAVRWSSGKQLCNLKNDAQFRFVGTRKSQSNARKAERVRLNAMATAKPDVMNTDRNPGDGGEPGE